jgi:hypothetical protein
MTHPKDCEIGSPEYAQWERDTEIPCIEFGEGKISKEAARARLIELGMDAEIVDEGLTAMETGIWP